jgi:hypothetical protein
MAHFAEIENGKVIRVIVAETKEWCETNLGGEWVQTSYNTRGGIHYSSNGQPDAGLPLNKNYAAINYNWDGIGFSPAKCHNEAILNNNTYLWVCNNPEHTKLLTE